MKDQIFIEDEMALDIDGGFSGEIFNGAELKRLNEKIKEAHDNAFERRCKEEERRQNPEAEKARQKSIIDAIRAYKQESKKLGQFN